MAPPSVFYFVYFRGQSAKATLNTWFLIRFLKEIEKGQRMLLCAHWLLFVILFPALAVCLVSSPPVADEPDHYHDDQDRNQYGCQQADYA